MMNVKIPDSWKEKLQDTMPCWIVWETDRITRTTNMRAICTTEENAKIEKMLADGSNKFWDREKERVIYIEKSRLNHLFGESMYADYFKNKSTLVGADQ